MQISGLRGNVHNITLPQPEVTAYVIPLPQMHHLTRDEGHGLIFTVSNSRSLETKKLETTHKS